MSMQSPNGSGADAPWPDEWNYDINDEYYGYTCTGGDAGEDFEDEEYSMATSHAMAAELLPGQIMNTKVPPAFNGRGSWFAFEELVYDWLDITVLDKDKQGPALRNRLCDTAVSWKRLLDRERLKQETTGVEYFINFLRPHPGPYLFGL